jgi:NAD+ synthase
MMPYKTSNPKSEEDAFLVVEKLGMEHSKVDITPMVEPLFQAFPQMDQLRKGNVMARERMIILYDQSKEKEALVLGTGNKTEYLLGYTTLWGDMACALAPLGDLYKTQVYQLAAFLGVPKRILQKKPSADLWAGQTDEEELGFTYGKVDTLLYYMVDKRFTFSELEELGYRREFVRDIFKRIQTSQYKRRLPLIAKLSERTIDRDFK